MGVMQASGHVDLAQKQYPYGYSDFAKQSENGTDTSFLASELVEDLKRFVQMRFRSLRIPAIDHDPSPLGLHLADQPAISTSPCCLKTCFVVVFCLQTVPHHQQQKLLH